MKLILLSIFMVYVFVVHVDAEESIHPDTVNYIENSNFAIKKDGSLWSWGENPYGRLGDGTSEEKITPIQILENVISVKSGGNGCAAIKKDGSLWTWGGKNTETGANTYSLPVRYMEDVIDVSIGRSHTLILKKDKTLWGYGFNDFGQIGQTELIEYSEPHKIMNNVEKAVAGDEHSIILKTDGSVWTLGNNFRGALGVENEIITTVYYGKDNNFSKSYTTKPIKIYDSIKNIYSGMTAGFAISNDDKLLFWGSTWGDMLGASTDVKNSPIYYTDNVRCVSSQYFYNLVLKKDDTLWIYGKNGGKETLRSYGYEFELPMKVMDDVNYINGNSNGDNRILLLKNNGELYHFELANNKAFDEPKGYKFTKIADDVKLMEEIQYSEPIEFKDIGNQPEETQKAIRALADAKIINGTYEDAFSPNKNITRAEITAILLRMTSKMEENENGGFLDVTENDWYYGVAGASKKHNIVKGFEDNTFRPNEAITREQLISLTVRTLKNERGYKINEENVNLLYNDSGEISDWALDDVMCAIKTGLILTSEDGFEPKSQVNRGEAAVILYRLYNII